MYFLLLLFLDVFLGSPCLLCLFWLSPLFFVLFSLSFFVSVYLSLSFFFFFVFVLSSLLVPLHTLTFSTAHMRTCNGPRSCGDDYLIAWIKNRIVSFFHVFASFVSPSFFPLCFPSFCSFLSPLVSAGSSESCFLSFFFFWFLFFSARVFLLSDCSLCFTLCLSLFYLVPRSSRCLILCFSLFHFVSLLVPHRFSSFFNSLCMAQENNRCTW